MVSPLLTLSFGKSISRIKGERIPPVAKLLLPVSLHEVLGNPLSVPQALGKQPRGLRHSNPDPTEPENRWVSCNDKMRGCGERVPETMQFLVALIGKLSLDLPVGDTDHK